MSNLPRVRATLLAPLQTNACSILRQQSPYSALGPHGRLFWNKSLWMSRNVQVHARYSTNRKFSQSMRNSITTLTNLDYCERNSTPNSFQDLIADLQRLGDALNDHDQRVTCLCDCRKCYPHGYYGSDDQLKDEEQTRELVEDMRDSFDKLCNLYEMTIKEYSSKSSLDDEITEEITKVPCRLGEISAKDYDNGEDYDDSAISTCLLFFDEFVSKLELQYSRITSRGLQDDSSRELVEQFTSLRHTLERLGSLCERMLHTVYRNIKTSKKWAEKRKRKIERRRLRRMKKNSKTSATGRDMLE